MTKASNALDALNDWLDAHPNEFPVRTQQGVTIICAAIQAHVHMLEVCRDMRDHGLAKSLATLLSGDNPNPRPRLKLVRGG